MIIFCYNILVVLSCEFEAGSGSHAHEIQGFQGPAIFRYQGPMIFFAPCPIANASALGAGHGHPAQYQSCAK